MEKDDDKGKKGVKLVTINGGRKKGEGADKEQAAKGKGGDSRNQVYVNDARFQKALELIRQDMNQAFQLGNMANTQHYFLVKFLVEKGVINEDEFTRFLHSELSSLEKSGDKE